MANKITTEDIEKINECYYRLKKYAAVARETGFSPSTIKKYVKNDWKPESERKIRKFNANDIPEFDDKIFNNIKNFGELCVLSSLEKKEIEELWGELSL